VDHSNGNPRLKNGGLDMRDAKRLLSRTALAAIAALACATILSGASQAHAPRTGAAPTSGDRHGAAAGIPAQTRDLLRQARRATRPFRDVEAAKAAGYERASECEDDPKYGAMGIHYVNPTLIADGRLDVERPELLVYQPTRRGKLRLGAIEYFQVDADQDLATDPDRPWMFEVPFDGPMLGHNPEMPIHYDLHVWLYRHNPAGLFAAWNPRVQCPA
jgi:hypothetical protein